MPAFEAVLADIDRRGITRIICLGDLVGKGPDSARAVDICVARCEAVVQGNWDDSMATALDPGPTFRWHQATPWTRSARLSRRTCQTASICDLSGHTVRLLHASPAGCLPPRLPNRPDREADVDVREHRVHTGHDITPDIVGYGDIHSAYIRSWRDRMLFNAGSVGNPLDMTLACYAVLEGVPGETAGPVSVTIVRVPYDIERAIADAEAVDMPEPGGICQGIADCRLSRAAD